METTELPLDSVYGILSESRRRFALYNFLDSDHANIEGLSLQIAAWEQGVTIDAVSEERKQRVTTSLLHSHLPKLEDHGIVEYDSRTGDVIAADGFDEIRMTVDQARASETDVEVTSPSKESFLYSEPLTEPSNIDQGQ